MNDKIRIRRDISRASFNDNASTWLFGEILVISVFVIMYTDSWILFGLAFFGMIAMTMIRRLAIILTAITSIIWGIAGIAFGMYVNGIAAAIVIGLILFLVSAGAHLAALEWLDDMNA